MSRDRWRAAALPLALLALFVALGGSVYAAAKIDGRTIKVKSLPGNRIKPASLPGNRLKPGAIPGDRLAAGSLTGRQIDTATLGEVPSAIHAAQADVARDAETALHAVNAVNASKVNGRSVGCRSDERYFGGACWEAAYSDAVVSAPAAAVACASRGAELPEALQLVAFAQQSGLPLASGDEWSGDISVFSGPNVYTVATVSSVGQVDFKLSTDNHKFRCVRSLIG